MASGSSSQKLISMLKSAFPYWEAIVDLGTQIKQYWTDMKYYKPRRPQLIKDIEQLELDITQCKKEHNNIQENIKDSESFLEEKLLTIHTEHLNFVANQFEHRSVPIPGSPETQKNVLVVLKVPLQGDLQSDRFFSGYVSACLKYDPELSLTGQQIHNGVSHYSQCISRLRTNEDILISKKKDLQETKERLEQLEEFIRPIQIRCGALVLTVIIVALLPMRLLIALLLLFLLWNRFN